MSLLLNCSVMTGAEITVLEKQLLPYLSEELSFSSFILRSWSSSKKAEPDSITPFPEQPVQLQVTAFVGNGKIGLSLDQDSPLLVRSRRGLVCAFLPFDLL
jgi:hypothetical protein